MNSTLALKKSDYESEVGDFLGLGRGELGGEEAWADEDKTRIQMDVSSGLKRFYFCGHPWSFLKPFAELLLKSGETTVRMPDDFGGVDDGVQVAITNSSLILLAALDFTGPGRVQKAISELPNATGMPRLISQRPVKNMPAGKMQVSELFVFPTSDQDYTLTFPYFITPNYLTDVSQPYAYGGVEHHETILECCLAVAEARRDNVLTVHSAEAQRLLAASIQMDKRKQPNNLGYNNDRSDKTNWWERWNGHGWSNTGGGVTVNGTLYD